MWWILLPVAGLTVAAAGVFLWRPVREILGEVQMERARELFHLQRERLEAKFVDLAAASGKPKGLEWADCDWADEVVFARDRQSGMLTALVGVIVRFEAVPGGPMEDVEAVANLRNATGVFFYRRGQWATSGRALFNLNPDEALAHLQDQFQPLSLGESGV